MLGDAFAQAGRLDEALAAYREIIAAEPSDPRGLYGVAETLRRRGDLAGAINSLRKAFELSDEIEGVKALAKARTEEDYDRAQLVVSRSRLEQLEQLAKVRYVSPFDLGRLHALMNDRDQAFAELQRAVDERSAALALLKVDRAWDRIRDDPRFAAIVEQVGIP
jgi:tetratricopeptide (TPR) repeat protein